MPCAPTHVQVSLLAGLICLCIALTGPGWGREAKGASPRSPDISRTWSQASLTPLVLAARPGPAAAPSQSQGAASPSAYPSQSTAVRLCTGGLLGPLLCHYVFGYRLSSLWLDRLWPPGLLDILVLAALGYLGYRLYGRWQERKKPAPVEMARKFVRSQNLTPPPVTITEEAKSGLAAIQTEDTGFDLTAFGEVTHRLLLELYAAWTRQELEALAGRVKEGLLDYLRMGLKIMTFRDESSFLEDLSLEAITVTAAGVNDGKEFITVCFRGWMLDYVVDKKRGKLLVGSMAYPKIFQEYWDLERPRGENAWVLQDIREK
jgi:hypothetical protein